jgi:hypothetical protein
MAPATARQWPADVPVALAAASVVLVRSPAAKPDGKKSCKTAGRDYEWLLRSELRSPDVRSRIIPPQLLGAGPRRVALDKGRRILTSQRAMLGLELSAGALRTGIDTADFEPAVLADHEQSADIGDSLACAAIAELLPGTRGYSIELEGGSVEMAARIL